MKTINIFKSLALFAAFASFAACEPQLGNDEKPEEVTPNFPELVENYAVEPGSMQEVVFTPNLDWKVTIPSEMRQWFWIQDGTFKVTELTGTASEQPVKVLVGVTETAEFDKNFSCDVTLQLGDSTKVVAKYMLPAKEKTMQVYVANTLSDSEFEIAEDGVSYVYGTEEAAKLDLIWSASDADFRLPVKIVSNCEWTMTVPEWAEVNVPETTTGVVELVIKGESIEGAAGKVAFCYGESTLVELDVTIPSCGGVDVYSPKFEEGEFEFGEDGEYAWSESPVNEVSLAWLGSDFRVPVKVSARCNWTVVTPDWLTVELPEKTAGDVTLTFLGVPSLYPLDDTSSKVVFKSGDSVIDEIVVNIPGCRDIMTFTVDMGLTALEFNYIGHFKTSTGFVEGSVTGHLKSSKLARVFAVETTGNKVGKENPEWFTVEISNWNTSADADVLQERTLTFTAAENKGANRSAVVFVLPPSVTASAGELFNEDASVKEEYAQYSIPVVQGSMNYDDYITVKIDESAEYAYTFEKASQEKKDELTAIYGNTDHVYVLNYESPYCSEYASMTMAIEFASYKIFSNDGTLEDKSGVDKYWLQYQNIGSSNGAGVIDMYFNKKNVSEDNPAEVMPLPAEPSVGYVVFYNADNEVLAIVECISPFEPLPEPVLDVDQKTIVFTGEAATETLLVTSNVAWTIESDASWCTTAISEGEGDASVVVSVEKNESGESRSAVLTLKSETITVTIDVTQKVGAVLEVDKTELEYGFFACNENVTVTSNVAWTIESDQDWCTVNLASGEGKKSVKVTVSRNTTAASRTAVLTIKADDQVKTVNVTQHANDGSQTTGLKDEYGNVFNVADSYFVSAADAKAAGAGVYECVSGPYYDKYKRDKCPILMLEYTSADTELEIKVPSEILYFETQPLSYKEYISVNGMVYDFETNGALEEAVDVVKIKMDPKVAEDKAAIEKNKGLYVVLHADQSAEITLVIACRLTL
ncbi:MAG: BACON domain-containing protein [Bacteroidales bacterium]|nr:BACON domain-containing protein [Bacteroidales bacterium]